MGARYYDPARGRFTQLDPLGNGYGYTGDNPVNFTDPSGLCPDNVGCNDHYDNGPGGAIGGGSGTCGCGSGGYRPFDDDDDGGSGNGGKYTPRTPPRPPLDIPPGTLSQNIPRVFVQ
jgi:hypothetical protein